MAGLGRKAGIAEAMKLSPSPRPTTSGHSLRAPTSTLGLVGGHRDERVVAAQLVVGQADGLDQVAVEVRGDQVRHHLGVGLGGELGALGLRRSRSSVQFSTIPLSTMCTRSEVSQCGCALASVTRPWVAQRVWPMPVEPLQVPVRLGDGVAQVLQVADGVHAADGRRS